MNKTVAYLRVSTNQQDLKNQRYEILEYAQRNGMRVDEFIEVEMSSRKDAAERKIAIMSKGKCQVCRYSKCPVKRKKSLGKRTVKMKTPITLHLNTYTQYEGKPLISESMASTLEKSLPKIIKGHGKPVIKKEEREITFTWKVNQGHESTVQLKLMKILSMLQLNTMGWYVE